MTRPLRRVHATIAALLAVLLPLLVAAALAARRSW
jgi:cytochrome b